MKPSYHTASIRELKKLFASLPVPEQAMRDGFFRASFIGPAWYRISGFPSVHVAGLPYWQGKKCCREQRCGRSHTDAEPE